RTNLPRHATIAFQSRERAQNRWSSASPRLLAGCFVQAVSVAMPRSSADQAENDRASEGEGKREGRKGRDASASQPAGRACSRRGTCHWLPPIPLVYKITRLCRLRFLGYPEQAVSRRLARRGNSFRGILPDMKKPAVRSAGF